MAGIEILSGVTATYGLYGASGGIESDLLNELPHFVPAGTRRFSSSNQLSTTLICVGAAPACSVDLSIRNRGRRQPDRSWGMLTGSAGTAPSKSIRGLPASRRRVHDGALLTGGKHHAVHHGLSPFTTSSAECAHLSLFPRSEMLCQSWSHC